MKSATSARSKRCRAWKATFWLRVKIFWRDSGNAKKFDQAKEEAENASRRRQALQVHGDRQDRPRPFRQTPFHRHQALRPHAQAQKVDPGQLERRRRGEADASLWLRFCAESQRNPQLAFQS